jgi:hypothetical protein
MDFSARGAGVMFCFGLLAVLARARQASRPTKTVAVGVRLASPNEASANFLDVDPHKKVNSGHLFVKNANS